MSEFYTRNEENIASLNFNNEIDLQFLEIMSREFLEILEILTINRLTMKYCFKKIW